MAFTAAELAWLHTLFKELKLFLPHIPILWCNNNSVIALASNPVFHSKTKHIKVDYHYVRGYVLRHYLGIKFISGLDNFTDIFTKPLSTPHFLLLHGKLLVDTTTCLRGDVKSKSTEQNNQSRAIKVPKQRVVTASFSSNG